MKKILLIIISILLITPNVFAKNAKEPFSFKNLSVRSIKGFHAQSSDTIAVKKTLEDLNKYTNEKNIEEIKNIYDKNFYSGDSFDYESYIKMVEETFAVYSEIKYKSKIKNISVTDDWAIVQMSDKTTATLMNQDFDDPKGELEGYCDYTLYLRKYNDKWKIISDHVEYEETSLKYGEAKNYKMDFISPLIAEKGKSYDITLKMLPPKGTFVVATLGKEEIIYPPQKPKDAFRKLPAEGILERVVVANTKGNNEYASASIGFTKLSIEDDEIMRIKLKMSGMAFIMKRINIINEKPKEKPEPKKAEL